jgi:hypothetical protein
MFKAFIALTALLCLIRSLQASEHLTEEEYQNEEHSCPLIKAVYGENLDGLVDKRNLASYEFQECDGESIFSYKIVEGPHGTVISLIEILRL